MKCIFIFRTVKTTFERVNYFDVFKSEKRSFINSTILHREENERFKEEKKKTKQKTNKQLWLLKYHHEFKTHTKKKK